MTTLVKLVNDVLIQDGLENAADTHKRLQEIGIYNYKTGLLLDTSFLNTELANRKLAKGGRLKSALNRDRAYKSEQTHEQAYQRRVKPLNPKYKMARGGGVSRNKGLVDYMEKVADKIVSHYLPGAEGYEVTGRNYQNEGDYNLDTDIEGDGSHNVFINVYFGNRYAEADKKLTNEYDSYAKFLEDLGKKKYFN